jgi:hypothetical protein
VRVERAYIKDRRNVDPDWAAQLTMVQPAESFLRKDPTPSCGTNPAVRCPLLKSEMRAVLMMVTNTLAVQSLQMAFIQRNSVVQQISSAASHPPLRAAMPPWTPEPRGCPQYGQTSRRSHSSRLGFPVLAAPRAATSA